MLWRTAPSRRWLMTMLSRTTLGRRLLMLMSGLGSFLGQIRRDALDAKSLDRRYRNWRRGSGKRAGRVVVGDHHCVIARQQKTQAQ
jgi:hypothetical protein